MKTRWKNKVSLLFASLMAWWVFGCAAVVSNPAAPPAPLSELPSSLNFPSSVKVDTPELNIAAPSSALTFDGAKAMTKDAVLPIGGEFFEAITLGFTINQSTDSALAVVLGALQDLNIPFNPITRTFQQSGGLQGIFTGAAVKIDFADYDFNGNGQTVGCTGCTCPFGCDAACPNQGPTADLKPVCFRVWVDATGTGDYKRFMAGFFNQVPFRDDPSTPENEENPGVGTIRLHEEFGATDTTPPLVTTNIGTDYNHRDPNRVFDKSTSYYISTVQSFGNPDATNTFTKVEQKGFDNATSADQVMKTLRESAKQEVFTDPTFDSTFQYIARYRTDINPEYWSGTFHDHLFFPEAVFVNPPTIADFTGACAVLETAIGVADGTCIDLGIDVTNVPFLDLLTTTDPRVNLPADFPTTPTF